jgi:hypothetical protein
MMFLRSLQVDGVPGVGDGDPEAPAVVCVFSGSGVPVVADIPAVVSLPTISGVPVAADVFAVNGVPAVVGVHSVCWVPCCYKRLCWLLEYPLLHIDFFKLYNYKIYGATETQQPV